MFNLSKPLAFFDLETTGTVVGQDSIVEIAVIKVHPGGEQEELNMRINPGKPIPPGATKVHGISDEDVKNCPNFKEAAHEIHRFLEGCDLAGFNSNKFDVPLLVEEFLRADIDFDLKNRRLVDVQNIFHKMEQRTLKAAYKFYCQGNLVNNHNAMADTKATLEILMAQIDRYKETPWEGSDGKVSVPVKNDVKALHEFSIQNRFADLAGHLVFNEDGKEVFNFGKHKGQTVEDVLQKEPGYYGWLQNADFPLYTKKIITAIKLRGFSKK